MESDKRPLSRKDRKKGFWARFGGNIRESLTFRKVGLRKLSFNGSLFKKMAFPTQLSLVLVFCLGLFCVGIYLGLRSAQKTVLTETKVLEASPTASVETSKEPRPTGGTETITPSSISSREAEESPKPAPEKTSDASAEPAAPSLRDLKWPCQGEILKTPGWYYSDEMAEWRYFPGVYIGVASETPVKAALPGVVKCIDSDAVLGQILVVGHGGELETRYGGILTDLTPGVSISPDQVIGKAKGSSVFFQVVREGEGVDPLEFLKKPGQ